jgi:hypothetical protein
MTTDIPGRDILARMAKPEKSRCHGQGGGGGNQSRDNEGVPGRHQLPPVEEEQSRSGKTSAQTGCQDNPQGKGLGPWIGDMDSAGGILMDQHGAAETLLIETPEPALGLIVLREITNENAYAQFLSFMH